MGVIISYKLQVMTRDDTHLDICECAFVAKVELEGRHHLALLRETTFGQRQRQNGNERNERDGDIQRRDL